MAKTMEERIREYKEQFKKNQEFIIANIPEYKRMTDEEIDAYITPERVQLHDWAVEYTKKMEKIQQLQSRYNIPESFTRNLYGFLDKSGAPEADEKNARIMADMSNRTQHGYDWMVNAYGQSANKIMSLDKDKLVNSTPEEMYQYIKDNIDIMEIGMEYEHTKNTMTSTTNIKLSEFAEDNFQKISRKGVALGSMGRAYRELMADDNFLTLPTDKLKPEQAAMLMSAMAMSKDPQKEQKGKTFALIVGLDKHKKMAENFKETDEPDKRMDFTKDSKVYFRETVPSLDQARNRFEKMYNDLKSKDAWYNWNNSQQYKDLLKELKNLNGQLAAADGEAITDNLKESFEKVAKAADDYQKHVGAFGKNTRQQERLDITRDIARYTGALTGNTGFERFKEKSFEEVNGPDYRDNQRQAELEKEERDNQFKKIEDDKLIQVSDRTKKMEEKLAGMPEGAMKDILEQTINARKAIEEELNKPEPDMDVIKANMPTVMAGTRMQGLGDESDVIVSMMFGVQKENLGGKGFELVTQNLSKQDVVDFMGGSGEHNMVDSIIEHNTRMKKAEELQNQKQVSKEMGGPEPINPNNIKINF